MSNNARDIKLKLFEVYSKNLSDVLSQFGKKGFERPTYICPLCRREFTSEQLKNTGDNFLTIEHILPESVGGNEIVLTCKQCNNNYGSKLDSHLKRGIDTMQFNAGGTGVNKDAHFKIDDGIESNGRIYFNERGIPNFHFEGRRTNPKHHDYLKKLVQGKVPSGTINFKLSTYDRIKFKAALLKSAYLKAFKDLGYIYMLNVNSEIPRKSVLIFDSSNQAFEGVFRFKDDTPPFGLSILTKPKELQGYLVSFMLKIGKKNEHYGVILPGGNDNSSTIYGAFKEYKMKNQQQLSFDFTPLNSFEFLEDMNCMAIDDYWRNPPPPPR